MKHISNLRVLPKIFYYRDILYCNDTKIKFRPGSCSGRLVRIFSLDPDHCFSRSELAKLIYGCDNLYQCSPRMYQSTRQNLTKLVSRTRLTLETKLNSRSRPWIEFFVYNQEVEGWYFYRLKNEYLRGLEQAYYKIAS